MPLSTHCLYEPRYPFGRPKATIASGAVRVFGSPSTGYQSKLPATKTSGLAAKRPCKPPTIVTIHWYWSVLSAMGRPSSSGYSTSDGGVRVDGAVLMSEPPDEPGATLHSCSFDYRRSRGEKPAVATPYARRPPLQIQQPL